MNIEERDLLSQFSAYVKVSIKHTRKDYLEKRAKIRSCEVEFFEESDTEIELEGKDDLLQQVEQMSGNLKKKEPEVRLLMEQIEDPVLYQAIRSLTRQQKEVLMLRILYMRSFAEIGSMLGMTPKKAENTYFNAIKKVRKMIGGGKNGI